MSLKEQLVKSISESKSILKEDLAKKFQIPKDQRKDFYNILKQMEKEGRIFKNKDEKYQVIDNRYQIKGKLQGNEKGFGFVLPIEDDIDDIYVDGKNLNTALHGDIALVNITRKSSDNYRSEGEIIKILERANKRIVGIFQKQKEFGFVVPDDKRINRDVFVRIDDSKGAKDGQKVIVEVDTWAKEGKNPEGKIVGILGFPEDRGVDVLSVALSMQLPMNFNKKTIKEANAIEQELDKHDYEDRVDLRDLTTFTIDGKDSKDFDDAVSIDRLENGNYLLGVHIADVAHYVREGSALNKEAYKRGNSVYLIDKVIPMLPFELSNGICSLNPKVDRLCLSVTMEINSNGKVVNHKIEESVINSKARLVYDHVSDFLEDHTLVHESLKGLEEKMLYMEELAEILRKRRINRGAVNFDFPEMEITLNKLGVPIDISRAERRVANKLIEEFMLVCNETVAEQFYWLEVPFLYRIHEDPDSEKIESLNKSIRNFGYSVKNVGDISPRDVQLLVTEVENTDKEVFVETLILRSLKKAKYSSSCEGHFALAAKFYTHFTSPIRRYCDLQIHRIIKAFITNRLSPYLEAKLDESLPNIAEHISETERLAQEAERRVEDIKAAQYMEDHIGEIYKGIVSSVTSFGIFVQLENTIEGLVSYNKMLDYFIFDEETYRAVGETTGAEYTLGDKVSIKVVDADSLKGIIDFMIVSDDIEEE